MGLFSKKNKPLTNVPKNEIQVTGSEYKDGTKVLINVNDKMKNMQYFTIMMDIILNLVLDTIIRYNMDVDLFIKNFNEDIKRNHHNYIQSKGEDK